jgi:hypothetical protein
MNRALGTAALVAVVAMFLAVGCYKIAPVDIPWHLATGRLILEQHRFPVTNTFSWTFPDYTLNQQYPLFQVGLALIVDHLGWDWVTVANAAGWALGLLAWMRYAGPWREAAQQPLLWLVVALGVQRHHTPRPEMLTVLGLGLILLGLERLRKGDRWGALVVIGAQWVMVNSHQLWILGPVVQGLMLAHLAVTRIARGRWRVSTEDANAPWEPFVATFAGSLVVGMASPLGPRVYLAPLAPIGTLLTQGMRASGGAQARELMPVWTDPLSLGIALILVAVLGFWLWRARERVVPFELGLAALGIGLVAVAIRGIPFASLCAGVVAARSRARAGPALPPESPVHVAGAIAAILVAARLSQALLTAEPAFYRVQPGFGRSEGEWQDRAVAFLRADRPPGEMLNIGWVAGNPMIGGLWPVKRVFVDPRWEAYPRDFLLTAIAAASDGEQQQRLIDQWSPGFVVIEVPDGDAVDRLADLRATGEWRLVYADSLLAVLVREVPDHADWLARHPAVDPATWDPGDWVEGRPVLLAEQRIRVAHLLRRLGQPARADALIAQARALADDPIVAEKLADEDAAQSPSVQSLR